MSVYMGLVDLLPVAVGALGTLGITAWTQRRAERREELRYRRDREREDENRVYEHRRAAYANFLTLWQQKLETYLAAQDEPDPAFHDPSDDWLAPLWSHLEPIELYGSQDAHALAKQAASMLFDHVYGSDGPAVSSREAQEALSAFRQLAREELGISE